MTENMASIRFNWRQALKKINKRGNAININVKGLIKRISRLPARKLEVIASFISST